MAAKRQSEDMKLQEPSTRAIMASWVDPCTDLANERLRSNVNVHGLAKTVSSLGRSPSPERQKELLELIERNPVFSKESLYFWNQTERYARCLEMSVAMVKMAQSGEFTFDELRWMRDEIGLTMPDDVHYGMFVQTLIAQCDDEQREEWVGPAMLQQGVIGTYAQTELGHGTFLRGLETTATYDAEREEFILHSPTPTATKWWPGGLGKTANHCTLYARLFIAGKDYGPHAFIVQLRDMETHLPLPGIEVGDIGPKFGFNGIDNGFLRLNFVRIPRRNMLMRFARVTESGEYVSPPHAKANYGTMVHIRVLLVSGAYKALGKAVTIATRYSAVRRQSSNVAGQPEKQVIDYQNQQYLLFPLIAGAYAMLFTQVAMQSLYDLFLRDSASGDFSTLAELHSVSSGLKAVCTWIAADGIEICRRACGGHGYNHFSGLPALFSEYVAMVTLEGDNNVMCLQTARHLVKSVHQLASVKPVGSVAYLVDPEHHGPRKLAQCRARRAEEFLETKVQQQLWDRLSSALVSDAANAVLQSEQRLGSADEAWNANAVNLIQAAKVHCYALLVRNFGAALKLPSLPEGPTRAAIKDLCDLFALTHLETLGGFAALLQNGFIDGAQVDAIRHAVRHVLLPRVRVNAVALVDSFGFSDYALNSALGRRDGDVYNALFRWAQKAPMNASAVGPGYAATLAPHLHRAKL